MYVHVLEPHILHIYYEQHVLVCGWWGGGLLQCHNPPSDVDAASVNCLPLDITGQLVGKGTA